MIFHVPILSEHIRSFKDPQRPGIRVIHALAQVAALPKDIPLDPDPRVPRVKGPIVRRISESLRSNDGRFYLLNRGITISAKETEFDNKRNVLKLNIPDNEAYGIIDGGHTYHAVKEVVQEILRKERPDGTEVETPSAAPPLADQYVHLEILVGIESHLADIAEARNFSVSLKAWTLAGYRDKFDWLLEALGDDFIIQVMCAVNPGLYGPNDPPVEAYKNAGKCLDYFVAAEDKYCFKKLGPICRDVLRLYDYIRFHWKDAYNTEDEAGKRGRLGALASMKQRKRNRAAMATYYFLDPKNGPVKGEDLPIEKGLAIPVISSLRALLEEKRNSYGWYTDPFGFFDQHGSKLVKLVMASCDASGGDPHAVGRDPQTYTALYSEVRRWYLEGRVLRLENKGAAQQLGERK
jgi:hypothetical protein